MFIGRYVCICMKVTLKDIEEAVDNGAHTFKDVHIKTLCGGKCGVCIDKIKQIVDDMVKEKLKK